MQAECDNYVSPSIKSDTNGHLSQVLKGNIEEDPILTGSVYSRSQGVTRGIKLNLDVTII